MDFIKLLLLIEGLWFLKKVCKILWLSDFLLAILLHSH